MCALGGRVEHPRVAERLEIGELAADLVGIVWCVRPVAGDAHGVAEQVAVAEAERVDKGSEPSDADLDLASQLVHRIDVEADAALTVVKRGDVGRLDEGLRAQEAFGLHAPFLGASAADSQGEEAADDGSARRAVPPGGLTQERGEFAIGWDAEVRRLRADVDRRDTAAVAIDRILHRIADRACAHRIAVDPASQRVQCE